MEKLTLGEALRYLVVGYVMLAVGYVCCPQEVSQLYTTLGAAGAPVAALVAGSLVYVFYRPVLYNLLLFYVIDCMHQDNIRKLLMDRYGIGSRLQAELLWNVIQSEALKEKLPPLLLTSAGIHLLYMTSIVTLAGALFILFKDGLSSQFAFLFVVCMAVGGAAIASDYQIERQESLLFTLVDEACMDNIAAKVGYAREIKSSA